MKATGIVRRIDDLGRIVVPKEIRRTLRIREGDPLEIFTDREGEIILKKYSPIGELSQFAGEYAESLAQTTGHLVLITDCDHVVTASGNGKKEYEGKPISKQLEDAISERKNFLASRNDAEFVKVTLDDAGEFGQPGTNVFCIWCRMRWKGSMRRWSCRSSARGMRSEPLFYMKKTRNPE